MTINKKAEGNAIILEIGGRLDTVTSVDFETEVNKLGDVKKLVIDLASLEYISSAGLRVLLYAQKLMNEKGSMVVKNVSPEIMEIFEVTGFNGVLTIE